MEHHGELPAPHQQVWIKVNAPVAGQPVTFAITLVNETRAICSVTIDFGDGESRALGAVTATTVTHTYREAGVYTVTVRATDVAGYVAVSALVFEVAPPPAIPVTLSAAQAEPVAGQPVTFTVTVTPPAGATVRHVTLNFGDGSSAESLGAFSGSRTIAHVYAAAGSYIVTATVTDATGRRSAASLGVSVAEAPALPVTLSAAPDEPVAGQPVTFTVTVTRPAGAPAVREVEIDFGDDSDDESLGALSGSRTVAHVYENDGSYIVTVTVRDAAKRWSTASIGITVAEAASGG